MTRRPLTVAVTGRPPVLVSKDPILPVADLSNMLETKGDCCHELLTPSCCDNGLRNRLNTTLRAGGVTSNMQAYCTRMIAALQSFPLFGASSDLTWVVSFCSVASASFSCSDCSLDKVSLVAGALSFVDGTVTNILLSSPVDSDNNCSNRLS
jgi:hypothetical protein